MPELPDVEVFKQYFDSTALHQEIEGVDVNRPQILENISSQTLARKLKGHTFGSTRRHGKYLFAKVDDSSGWLVLHFGMTGFLKYFKKPEQEPAHNRLQIDFTNDYHLVYDCQRLFGQVEMTEAVEPFIAGKELGSDALAPDFDRVAFQEALAGSTAMIKSALMNQQLIAGIGNIYSDEILFQAGIHPKTRVNDLDDETLDQLFQTMVEVLETAIEHRAEPEQLPDSFIIPHRHEGGRCPGCGGPLEQIKVSGRTSYFCPQCQKAR